MCVSAVSPPRAVHGVHTRHGPSSKKNPTENPVKSACRARLSRARLSLSLSRSLSSQDRGLWDIPYHNPLLRGGWWLVLQWSPYSTFTLKISFFPRASSYNTAVSTYGRSSVCGVDVCTTMRPLHPNRNLGTFTHDANRTLRRQQDALGARTQRLGRHVASRHVLRRAGGPALCFHPRPRALR